MTKLRFISESRLFFLILGAILFPIIPASGLEWTQATAQAPWAPRSYHSSIVYNGKIWLLGGSDGNADKNDVWNSGDGATWTQVIAAAPWAPRRSHSSVVYDGKMWVLGGRFKNDVWYSTDGENWIQATNAAPWAGELHAAAVYDGMMWVIGGWETSLRRDVWHSTDGVSWIQATSSAPWAAREGHKAIVHDGRIWILGGATSSINTFSDVWHSTDGANWVRSTDDAGWLKRQQHSAVVFNNKIWVLGGRGVYIVDLNDVWCSADGVNWIQDTAAAPWAGRCAHTSVVFDSRIWVLGPFDVWYSSFEFDFPVGADRDSPETSEYIDLKTGKTYMGWAVPEDADFLSPNYDKKGTLHPGEDWNGSGGYNTDLGQPVFAVGRGRVVFSGDAGNLWGNVVMIEHNAHPDFPFLLPDGTTVPTIWSQYAHLDTIDEAVQVDETVDRDQKIGSIGRGYKVQRNKKTGAVVSVKPAYVAHLHFEIRTPVEDDDLLTWPFPENYWPTANAKDKEWVQLHYADPSDFINLNR